MQQARENLEVRVVSTGKGWRVDACEIGAQSTRTVARAKQRQAAIERAEQVAAAMRNLDFYGYVHVMIQSDVK